MTDLKYFTKNFLCLLPLLLLSCKNDAEQTTPLTTPALPTENTILWDFNGDKKEDNDYTLEMVKGEGNPVEDGTPDSYNIIFTDAAIPDLEIGCCQPILVGEGDLNGDGSAELTVVQAPMNGCTYDLTTWSLQNGKWQQVFGPEMIPTGCDELSADDLQNLIVKEKGKVYFYKTDVNDEDFKKVKTEIAL
jgi:hypothetical protein